MESCKLKLINNDGEDVAAYIAHETPVFVRRGDGFFQCIGKIGDVFYYRGPLSCLDVDSLAPDFE